MQIRDIDAIISAISERHPELIVQQLQVKYPGADDDGLWFFKCPTSNFEVQVESSSGMLPFLLETNRHNARRRVTKIGDAVELVEIWFGIDGSNSNTLC